MIKKERKKWKWYKKFSKKLPKDDYKVMALRGWGKSIIKQT